MTGGPPAHADPIFLPIAAIGLSQQFFFLFKTKYESYLGQKLGTKKSEEWMVLCIFPSFPGGTLGLMTSVPVAGCGLIW